MLRRRGGVLERLLHHGEEPVLVRVGPAARPTGCCSARARRDRAAAEHGIARMRFALGVDEDLRPFLREFAGDPLIGRSLRRRPWLRVSRRPEPFEALAWAICEQLIEYERAAAIERRVVARLGRRWPGDDGARRGPARPARAPRVLAATRAGAAAVARPGRVAGRWRSCARPARSRAGRIDLHGPRPRARLAAAAGDPGHRGLDGRDAGAHGQGRHDQVPAGDLGLLKLVGRLLSGGDPRRRATEQQVRELFAPYGEWAGPGGGQHMLAPAEGLAGDALAGARRSTQQREGGAGAGGADRMVELCALQRRARRRSGSPTRRA